MRKSKFSGSQIAEILGDLEGGWGWFGGGGGHARTVTEKWLALYKRATHTQRHRPSAAVGVQAEMAATRVS